MTEISHFQTYSKGEDVITNNCLLALRHFYEIDPTKLDNILKKILDVDEIGLGVTFKQQVYIHGKADKNKSILDGFVGQEPFRIYIETKKGGALNYGQIERHIENISNLWAKPRESNSYLLGLVKGLENPEHSRQIEKIEKIAKKKGIHFIRTTFARLLGVMEGSIEGYKDYDPKLQKVVSDFQGFLMNEKLLPSNALLSLGSQITMEANRQTGVYYEPIESADLPSDIKFIGLYGNKVIHHVGTLDKRNLPYNDASKDEQKRIDECLRLTGHKFKKRLKFHLTKKNNDNEYFCKTEFTKAYDGPQPNRRRYFWGKEITECKSAEELAEFLRGRKYNENAEMVIVKEDTSSST